VVDLVQGEGAGQEVEVEGVRMEVEEVGGVEVGEVIVEAGGVVEVKVDQVVGHLVEGVGVKEGVEGEVTGVEEEGVMKVGEVVDAAGLGAAERARRLRKLHSACASLLAADGYMVSIPRQAP
jgi:hypothetical protein